jgi:hypothetical protein
MSSRKELTLTLLLLYLLVLLPFWRVAALQGLVITNDYAVSDMAHLQHPLRHVLGQELHRGRLPLWTPGVYMGYPLLAEGQAGVFYPPNLLLFGLLPLRVALSLSILLPFVVAATGTYLLARRLGANVASGLLAGVAYALGGFFVTHVKHMPMVDAACWIPVVLWLVERGVTGSDRSLWAVGSALGMQWLAGAPQMAYYTAGVSALYCLGRAWQFRRARSLRRAAPLFALALLLSLGLGAVQLLPTFELVGLSERAGGVEYAFAARFPYALENLKTFLYPRANGDPGLGTYAVAGIFWEDYAYFGLLPLALGLIGGLALARRSGVARLLLALAALTFLLALGANTPLYELAFRLAPGMFFFRFPQRFLAFTVLFVTLLAALALTRLQKTSFVIRRSSFVGGLALLFTLVDLYAYHVPWNAIVDANAWLEPPETARAIHERAGDDLYRVFTHDAYNTFRAAYREAGGWRGDLSPYVAQREFLQPSLNLIYDVPAAEGYVNLVPECLVALWGNEKQKGIMDTALVEAGERYLMRSGFDKLFSLYNVRFLIADRPVQDEALELVGVFGPGAHLYENRQAMPRAFAVPGYAVADDVLEALEWMRSPAFDPATTVVLLETPATPSGSPAGFDATVSIVTYESTRVVIAAELNAPGWLVLSDTYYSGWEATVDGKPTPIYQADGCVRAVALEAGRHEVVFRFCPRSFRWGALVSGVSVVVWMVGCFLSIKKPGFCKKPGF